MGSMVAKLLLDHVRHDKRSKMTDLPSTLIYVRHHLVKALGTCTFYVLHCTNVAKIDVVVGVGREINRPQSVLRIWLWYGPD